MKRRQFIERIKNFRINPRSEGFIFFWCIVIAAVFWFLNALGEKYTSTITVALNYVNLPEDKTFSYTPNDQIHLRVTAPGWDLFGYYLKQSNTAINLDLSQLNNSSYFIPMRQRELLQQELPNELQILDATPDSIFVRLVTLAKKQVPVVVQTDSNFTRQYGLSASITAIPDSVSVAGPANVIDTISEIHTKTIELKGIKAHSQKLVELRRPEKLNLKYDHNSVTVNLPIEQLTQGKVEVPIQYPKEEIDFGLSIIPENVEITFQVALSNYNKMFPELFEARVDVTNIDTAGNNQLRVYLEQIPPHVYNIRIKPEYVRYVIKR